MSGDRQSVYRKEGLTSRNKSHSTSDEASEFSIPFGGVGARGYLSHKVRFVRGGMDRLDSDSSGPSKVSKFFSRSTWMGALFAVGFFVIWAAAAFAAVGPSDSSSDEVVQSSEATAVSATDRKPGQLAAMVIAGLLPAVFMVAREGRSRPLVGFD